MPEPDVIETEAGEELDDDTSDAVVNEKAKGI